MYINIRSFTSRGSLFLRVGDPIGQPIGPLVCYALKARPECGPAEDPASPDGEAEWATVRRRQQDVLDPIKRQMPWLPEA